MEALTAPLQSQLQTPPASQAHADNVPRNKFDATPIDDEDLFLGDDASDEVENDIPGEELAEDDEEDDDDDFDEDDFDEDYFASTYRPLSNLPTPPPSLQSSLIQSPSTEDDALESSLLGPAVHLVNMLPSACSIVTPSVPLVQAMLTRAQLPINTIALAVCILDSLDSRFARAWRLTCPLAAHQPPSATAGKRHTLPSPLTPDFSHFSHDAAPSAEHRLLHIDAVFPEVIILAALVIAAKFDDDGHATQQPAQAYCTAWSTGASLWTGAQLAATERCIMQSLNYRIMPLLDDELLADACTDMRRAGVQALRSQKMRAAAVATATAAAAAQNAQPKVLSDAQAMMTPPEEVVVAACRAPSHSSSPSSSPIPSSSAAPTGLGLQLPPSATQNATLTSHPSPLSSIKRRHHMPSHSECFGRYTYDH